MTKRKHTDVLPKDHGLKTEQGEGDREGGSDNRTEMTVAQLIAHLYTYPRHFVVRVCVGENEPQNLLGGIAYARAETLVLADTVLASEGGF